MSSNNSSTKSNNSTDNNNHRSKCNLIVNYLPQSLKEHDFCQLFAKIGPLRTCKLMYDRQTGYSFGYGFVEYQNIEDANKAIETLNGHQIEHKRLKVAYARPNNEETKNTNIYIRNLPITYTENDLHELFTQYGDVIQVRILRDQNTSFSRRVGFVIMSTRQMAQHAIENLDNIVPKNGTEPIHVKYADDDGKKRQLPRVLNNNFIHNTQITMYNPNNNANNNPKSGKMKTHHRGNSINRYNPMSTNNYVYSNSNNGFDNFFNASYNQHQHQHHHHHHHQQIPTTTLTTPYDNYFTHRQFNNSNRNHRLPSSVTSNSNLSDPDKGGHIIYVYGIGAQANEADLYSLFQIFGRVLRVNVIKNQKTGLGKGYGFVVFEHYEEACYAVQQMNGYHFNNRPLQVSFKGFRND